MRKSKYIKSDKMKKLSIGLGSAVVASGFMLTATQTVRAEDLNNTVEELSNVVEENNTMELAEEPDKENAGWTEVAKEDIPVDQTEEVKTEEALKEDVGEETAPKEEVEAEEESREKTEEENALEEPKKEVAAESQMQSEENTSLEAAAPEKAEENSAGKRSRRALEDSAHDPILEDKYFEVLKVSGEYEPEADFKKATQWVNVSMRLSDEVVGGDKIYFQTGLYTKEEKFLSRYTSGVDSDVLLDGQVIGKIKSGNHFESGSGIILTFTDAIKDVVNKTLDFKLPFDGVAYLYREGKGSSEEKDLSGTLRINKKDVALDTLRYTAIYSQLEKADVTTRTNLNLDPYMIIEAVQTPDKEKHLIIDKEENMYLTFSLSKDFADAKDLGVRVFFDEKQIPVISKALVPTNIVQLKNVQTRTWEEELKDYPGLYKTYSDSKPTVLYENINVEEGKVTLSMKAMEPGVLSPALGNMASINFNLREFLGEINKEKLEIAEDASLSTKYIQNIPIDVFPLLKKYLEENPIRVEFIKDGQVVETKEMPVPRIIYTYRQAKTAPAGAFSLSGDRISSTEVVSPERDLPFKTQYVANEKLEHGKTNELRPGENGRQVTVSRTVKQGSTVVREEKFDRVIKSAVDRIVEVGVKPKREIETKEYTIIYKENKDLDYGKTNVLAPGKAGEKETETTYRFFVDTGKTEVNQTIVIREIAPEDRVEERGVKPSTKMIETDFNTVYEEDSNLLKGEEYEYVKQDGEKGWKSITTRYTMNPKTGEVSATEDPAVLVKESKDKIIVRGSKVVTEKGDPLFEEAKPEIPIEMKKGDPLFEEAKPEIPIEMKKGDPLFEEAKPEILIEMKKGDPLVQEAKEALFIAVDKTEEKKEVKKEVSKEKEEIVEQRNATKFIKEKGKVPKTGDSSALLPPMMGIFSSLLGLGFWKKRRK